ncbi:MAG: carboxypeptidase-like regulatory domain-containing protein [Gemmatimonadota bacterium]
MFLPHRVSAVVVLLCAAPAALLAQTADQLRATLSIVSGHVVDEAGNPIADARIALAPVEPRPYGAANRVSGEDGSYRFEDLAADTYVISVEATGFGAAEHEVTIVTASDVTVIFRLSPSAIQLEPLVAVAERDAWFMDGFEERRAEAKTHTGFFTHDEMEEMNAKYITEVLWTVPGVNVRSRSMIFAAPGGSSRGPYAWSRPRPLEEGGALRPLVGPGCLALFVNGHHVGGAVPYDEIFPPKDIAALEVYGLQHGVPAQFHRPGSCGALVVWLREREYPALWKRLLAGAGVASAVWLLVR